jgi:hypothetical protein
MILNSGTRSEDREKAGQRTPSESSWSTAGAADDARPCWQCMTARTVWTARRRRRQLKRRSSVLLDGRPENAGVRCATRGG